MLTRSPEERCFTTTSLPRRDDGRVIVPSWQPARVIARRAARSDFPISLGGRHAGFSTFGAAVGLSVAGAGVAVGVNATGKLTDDACTDVTGGMKSV